MTRKQFDNKVRGFIWYVGQPPPKGKGLDIHPREVEEAIIDFYAVYRKIPRLGIRGRNIECAMPDENFN